MPLRLVTAEPQAAKRLKTDQKSVASKGLARLTEAEKTEILQRLIQDGRLSATKEVCYELDKRGIVIDLKQPVEEKRELTPLDLPNVLQSFGCRAYNAFHQLDHLLPHQQSELQFQVVEDIHDLIEEAQNFCDPKHAFMALARLATVTSNASDTGQVFRDTVASCGGLPFDLSHALSKQLRRLKPTDWSSLQDAYQQLLRVQSRLEDFAIEDFNDIVEEMAAHCQA